MMLSGKDRARHADGRRSCSRCLVCAAAPGASKKDLNRRTSSGNWIEDRVTWKEELNYKKAMGYL